MEVRTIELKHLDFYRKLLHIVQSKGNKDRYVPLSWKRGKLQAMQKQLNIKRPEAKAQTLCVNAPVVKPAR